MKEKTVHTSFITLIVCLFIHVLGVASYSLTISPEFVTLNMEDNVVVVTCAASEPIAGCHFKWRFYDDGAPSSPVMDLSRGVQSQPGIYDRNYLKGYSYNGKGLEEGDCGIKLQVYRYKEWMIGCRVRTALGGWKYAWMQLHANGPMRHQLPLTANPKEALVMPGEDLTLQCHAPVNLYICDFFVSGGNISLDYKEKPGFRATRGPFKYRYHGGGFQNGDCGFRIRNVTERLNGPAECSLEGKDTNFSDLDVAVWRGQRIIPVTVASPPGPPVFHVDFNDTVLTATCSVGPSRPVANITWYLGDEILRQDGDDDASADLEDVWRWPWVEASITQNLTRILEYEDNGKWLRCVVTHVALAQPLNETSKITYRISMCPPLASEVGKFSCYFEGQAVNCSESQQNGTSAELACKPGYATDDDSSHNRINCVDPGKWDRTLTCRPDCGRRNTNQGVPLISGGVEVRVGELPWHVAIYQRAPDGSYSQMCGGSLISLKVVISAAHCFWSEQYSKKTNSSNYKIAAGKHKRAWDDDDLNVQKRDVKDIIVHPRYHGRLTRFQCDIALLVLVNEVIISPFVNLICVDWKNQWENAQLRHLNKGYAAGWGYTEQDTLSDVLKLVELPYIDHDTCYASLSNDLRPVYTSDKFCAGYVNRSISACRGDSGGGLAYLQHESNKYYLRGLVSIAFSPPSNNAKCYSQSYTAFTLVSKFRRLLRRQVRDNN